MTGRRSDHSLLVGCGVGGTDGLVRRRASRSAGGGGVQGGTLERSQLALRASGKRRFDQRAKRGVRDLLLSSSDDDGAYADRSKSKASCGADNDRGPSVYGELKRKSDKEDDHGRTKIKINALDNGPYLVKGAVDVEGN